MGRLLIALLVSLLAGSASAHPPASIAIIIDDMGNNLPRGLRAINLPGALTYSVLPGTHFASVLANRAHAAGKEVMIHMPMANVSGAPLGPDALTDGLTQAQFTRILDKAIAGVPWARGLNNHMGSELTRQPEPMQWLMNDIRPRNFYFVDSRTTAQTVALKVAEKENVLASRRDVFLDNSQSPAKIDKAFRHLIHLAKVRGTAIAIAHPHDATLRYLEAALPRLHALGIRIVPVSRLIEIQHPGHVQYARQP